MHVEIRKANAHKKYYLAHSYRKNGKVNKVRIYLGVDLSESDLLNKMKLAENRIKERINKAKYIHDPYITALNSLEMNELKTLETKGKLAVIHLSEDEWLKFSEAFTYDTNAIEGSTIDVKEVKDILERKKWPNEKSKEEIAETYGVAEAIQYIRKTKEHISIALLLELHRIVFKNSKPFAGNLRPEGVEVVIADGFGNIVHRGAPASEVKGLLDKLVIWYSKNKKKYPPLVLAAVIHNQFETIHPFQDGNGRVGRLILNNILLKHGLPPLNIELKNRSEYYMALQAYQIDHNIRPMLELVLKEYRNLKRTLKRR